ncbi:MAG TPA: hypothetical protein VK071_11940 [Tissierellales bacterium]|nr:hypothetical protein [Tissierellales bacterium]
MEDDIYLIDRKGSIIRSIEKYMEEIFSYDELIRYKRRLKKPK